MIYNLLVLKSTDNIFFTFYILSIGKDAEQVKIETSGCCNYHKHFKEYVLGIADFIAK